MEAAWTTKRKDHEIYLGVEDAMKNLIVKAYKSCWLGKIENDILEFTMVSAMEMINHLDTECLKVTNSNKKKQIKNTEFPWLADEDVTVYFLKLEKEQVKLKAMKITWYDIQKVTQAVEETYNSNIFDKIQLMEWDNKDDIDRTWTNYKQFFKERYKTKKRFRSTQPTGFESVANLNEVHEEEMIITESNHNSERINVFQETSQSMVEMCAALAVAKAEQGDQIAKVTSKIDLLTKLVEKLLSQKPTPATTTTNKKYMNCDKCDKRHEKGMCWEDEKDAANWPRNWKLVKT